MYEWLEQKLEISHGNYPAMLSMEGLRGVAVFLVFWVHYSSLIQPWLAGSSIPVSKFIWELGPVGVDLFFVLSGYLIYGSIMNKPTFAPLKYATRRIIRIYPTFLVVFVAYVVLSFIFPEQSKLPEGGINTLKYIAQNLFLLPGMFEIEPIITVAWSLSYEIFYYLLIPCVIFLLRLQKWNVNNRILFWVLVSVGGFAYFALYGGPIRLMMFISGILVFEFHAKKNLMLHSWGSRFLGMALLLFGIRTIVEVNYPISVLVIFVLFILVCLCAFTENTRAYRWLTITPIRWLGNMSYSYYLVHGLALQFVFLVFGVFTPTGFTSEILYYWLWIPAFLFTLVTSFVLFWSVERPLSLSQSLLAKAFSQKSSQATAI